MSHALVVRMDRLGDVLLSGPLVRAVAAGSDELTYLAGPAGAPAARLLPGVDRVVVGRAGWIDDPPSAVTRARIDALVERVVRLRVDVAVVSTSFHQSPLPIAMVLRMAGISRIGAVSIDYPGSLLDVRHLVGDDIHEVTRALSLGEAMGYRLPPGDDGSLRIRPELLSPHASPDCAEPIDGDYVVVHPGASVTARAWHPKGHASAVERLADAGWQVVVTGGADERELTRLVAGSRAVDLGGQLDLSGLARLLARARALVVGNTGPAHLAAAVGTPLVSLYAPTVPPSRWRPWMVPHVLLGEQDIACAGCRARRCPVPGHPCLAGLDASTVLGAVEDLVGTPGRAPCSPSRPRAIPRQRDWHMRETTHPLAGSAAPGSGRLARQPS